MTDIRFDRTIRTAPVYGLPNPSVGLGTYAAAILNTQGLLAYWSLQETSGSFSDILGHYPGTASGSMTRGSSGPFGALPLSVLLSGGYINVGLTESASVQLSIEAWVKTTAGTGYVYGARNGNVSLSLYFGADGGGHGSAGCPRLFFDGPSLALGSSTVALYNDGNWHQLVGTFAGVSGVAASGAQFAFYVDGAAVATVYGPYGSLTPPWTSDAGQIGASGSGGSVLSGSIAGVSVYSVALPAATVKTHYTAAKG